MWVKPEDNDVDYNEAREFLGKLEPIVWRNIQQVTVMCYDDPAFGPVVQTPNGYEWVWNDGSESLLEVKLGRKVLKNRLKSLLLPFCVELETAKRLFLSGLLRVRRFLS